MSDFKQGDLVRLKKDCFNLPEWKRMRRMERQFFAGEAEKEFRVKQLSVFTFVDRCNTFDKVDAVDVDGGTFTIPSALLELVAPVKPIEHDEWDQYPVGTKMRVANKIMGVCFCVGDIVTKTTKTNKGFWPEYTRDSDGQMQGCKDEWLEPLAPTLHSYTPEQIAEARDIVYRLMCHPGFCKGILISDMQQGDVYDEPDSINKGRPHTLALRLDSTRFHGEFVYKKLDRAVAYCQPGDEWNDDIGRMVALCKLLREDLPTWVRGGAK